MHLKRVSKAAKTIVLLRHVVRPSVRNNSAPVGQILLELYARKLLLKCVDRIQIWLELDNKDLRRFMAIFCYWRYHHVCH